VSEENLGHEMNGDLESSMSLVAKKCSVTENKLPCGKCDVKHSYPSNRTMQDK
jgi:hypothetical protein